MRKTFVFTLITACAAAGVASMAGAVERQEAGQERTEKVTYHVASAATDAKTAKELFFRIRGAAAEVCEISSHPVGHELWATHACEVSAVAAAVREANVPALNAYYTDVTRRSLN